MIAAWQATLSSMLMLCLCILAGWGMKKARILPESGDRVLSRMETHLLVPALNIVTFMRHCTIHSLRRYYPMMLLSAGVVTAAIAIAYALSGRLEKDTYKRNIYRYGLTFGNYGFMGNALVQAILGEEMLYPYLLFTLPMALAGYLWGLTILIPRGETHHHPLRNLINPGVISILIGVALGLLGASAYMPAFVTGTLDSLANCMAPVAMVLTGVVIGGFPMKSLLTRPPVYLASALRLLLLPTLFVGGLLLLKADPLTISLTLFAYATPMGLNAVVFPAAYGGDTSTGASLVTVSHLFCVVTIPLLYTLLTLFL